VGQHPGRGTAEGAVWLDADMLSPYEFYQYWINCDDRDVERFLKLFTFLPLDEIARLAALQGAEIRHAKQVLALEATRITHGQEEAEKARAASEAAFGEGGDLEAVPTTAISAAQLHAGIALTAVMADVGLTRSRGEARRLIQQGGAYVNNKRVDDVNRVLTSADLTPTGITLRLGKKRHHRLVVE